VVSPLITSERIEHTEIIKGHKRYLFHS